jgi:hypothetical protein
MKAIETDYDGYLFRSRLEARWAVFFKEMGITYKYEPRTFDLPKYGWYVPDFWLQVPWLDLPDYGWYVEVKPKTASDVEFGKLLDACALAHQNGIMLQGSPFHGQYKTDKIQVWHVDVPHIIYDHKLSLFDVNEVLIGRCVRSALRRASTYKFS